MTIAELCIFASVILYLLTLAPVKWISAGRYDNARPRDPAFYQGGIRERALGAHQNGIEAFPFFAVAVLLAEFRAAPQNLINELSMLFLIVRTAYVLTYIGNRPALRSILWALGFLITVAIFFLPLLRNYLPI
ncbi:conserved membrane hypothetical protein [Bradyrhizobium sp. STM 3843]|uniref:MAPEG family protein n=1 Tax=unclassified Bradyrhizobium TaxID=2631580 RepID=UPI000240A965|nr:MAPEG family protein [Bradyrhizobium sp. STM 3843]CCE04957.1 conserved membrane hypothetical protein [Bradyrhizobium sp. STM 3843]